MPELSSKKHTSYYDSAFKNRYFDVITSNAYIAGVTYAGSFFIIINQSCVANIPYLIRSCDLN